MLSRAFTVIAGRCDSRPREWKLVKIAADDYPACQRFLCCKAAGGEPEVEIFQTSTSRFKLRILLLIGRSEALPGTTVNY